MEYNYKIETMEDRELKLFKITLQGFAGRIYSPCYAIAYDATEAYNKVREFLDVKDLGYSKNRELHSVELMAGTDEYTDAPAMLFN